MLFVAEEAMLVEAEATTVGLTARAAGRMSLFLVAACELKVGAGRPAGGQISIGPARESATTLKTTTAVNDYSSRRRRAMAPTRCSFASRIDPVRLTRSPYSRERRDPVVRPLKTQLF